MFHDWQLRYSDATGHSLWLCMYHINTEGVTSAPMKLISLDTNRLVVLPEVSTCISIHAMMHHMDTGEAVVTSNKI